MKKQLSGLWLRGKTYWLAATIQGFGRIRISLKTGDLAEAIKQAAHVKAYPERYFNKASGNIMELFLAHQERRGISRAWIAFSRVSLKHLASVVGDELQNASAASVGRWWSGLVDTVKPKTAKEYLGAVNTFYRWAINAGHLQKAPTALIIPPHVRPSPRRVFLAPIDALRLLDEAEEPDLRFAIYCALHCGLRRGEVIAARPRWFDLKAGLLHVQNEADWLTKDRDNRTIPLTAEFLDFLAWYGVQSPYMFRPEVAQRATENARRYRTDFRGQFDTHAERLGLSHITFHDLRRTFASLHVSFGTPIYSVAKWLGDEIGVVESTYGHLLPNDERINDPWNQARKQS